MKAQGLNSIPCLNALRRRCRLCRATEDLSRYGRHQTDAAKNGYVAPLKSDDLVAFLCGKRIEVVRSTPCATAFVCQMIGMRQRL